MSASSQRSAASRPMRAARSSSGASGSSSRIPTTVNQRPAIHTWIGASRSWMPSRCAADRSQHDRRVPFQRRVQEPAGPHRAAERVEDPLVDGLDRQAVRSRPGRRGPCGARWSAARSPRWPPGRAGSAGSCPAPRPAAAVSSPRNDCPGDTVSMLVPSRSRTASSDARLASEIARTATIAAMPMAMPTAVSDDRSLRDARPRPAIRATSNGLGPWARPIGASAAPPVSTGPPRGSAGAVTPPPPRPAGPPRPARPAAPRAAAATPRGRGRG